MHIRFNYPGIFALHTKELATTNKDYQSFSELAVLIGDMSPAEWISYVKENKRFNYNNIEERLWISMNLLRNVPQI
jgi:hypothetical protein